MPNTVFITTPALRVAAYGGGALVLELPTLAVASMGHNTTGEFAFAGVLPGMAVKAFGGINTSAGLPPLGAYAAGVGTSLATASLLMPALSVVASGVVAGQANTSATLPMTRLAGFGGAVISISLDNGLTVASSVSAGSVASAAVTLPLFDLVASATAQNHGGANVLLPAIGMVNSGAAWVALPSMQLVAVGHAVVTATFEAYALNLNHPPAQRGIPEIDELTRYTNFPFTHIVRYQNSYYGANSTGLYLLEGTTDDGALIDWEVETAITDFGSPQLKTVEMAYFGGRFGPETAITLIAGETTTNAYTHTTPRGAAAQNHRQPFGRGQKARYYALGASGNGEVTIDSITLNIATLARKV